MVGISKHPVGKLLLTIVVAIACGDARDASFVVGPDIVNPQVATRPVAYSAPVSIQLVNESDVPVPGAEVTITRSSGSWSATTDANGEAQITIQASPVLHRRRGAAGYYSARATDAGGSILGRWSSLPINTYGENALTLRIGGKAIIHPRGPILTVMTQNLYLGADINRILLAQDPLQIPALVAETWGVVQSTNFAERAEAIADQIKATRPHLIGLQEVTLFRMQDPGDLIIGGQTLPTEVVLDFLQILLDALESRGLDYEAVAIAEGIDIELPLAKSATEFADIRLTDREVILAHSGVSVSDVVEAQFQAAVPIEVGGVPTSIPRAYASVRATVAGRDLRFITAHLETGAAEPIQAFQAQELVGIIGAEALPVVLVGDFNSDANGTTTATYADILIPGGLVEVWAAVNPNDPGFTGSQTEDLLSSTELNRRIDTVFTRAADDLVGLRSIIVGDEEADRTPSGLWPSDHAGVVTLLRLPTVRPF